MKIDWEIKPFDELLPVELYNIMRLRGEVFVVEQTCPYLDADGKDPKCLHLMGYSGSSVLSVSSKEKTSGNIVSEAKELIAYSRIVPAGISYKEVSIGRVVSSPKVRGTGAGKALMEKSLEEIKKKFGVIPVKIGAQLYLKKFYESFGFVTVSDEYLEDDILHIEMLRK